MDVLNIVHIGVGVAEVIEVVAVHQVIIDTIVIVAVGVHNIPVHWKEGYWGGRRLALML